MPTADPVPWKTPPTTPKLVGIGVTLPLRVLTFEYILKFWSVQSSATYKLLLDEIANPLGRCKPLIVAITLPFDELM